MKVYAAWNPSDAQRQGSASGGVATMLARAVLEAGGVYFGTRWDEQMRPVVAWTETELEPFKGSRYVQSHFDAATREQLERFLAEGRTVLFVGTPCQVAALQALRDHPHLICVDLICHGTTSASYLEQELAYLASGASLTDVHFREGPLYQMSLWEKERCVYRRPAARSPYLYAYLSGLSLRDACYRCPYARPERLGDITLGDFIGYSKPGVSFVMTQTAKGEDWLKRCGAVLEERAFEERAAYRPGLLEPTAPSPLRPVFLKNMGQMPFPQAVRKTLRGYFRGLPFRQAWKWLHHQAHLVKSFIKGK